jgi:hypothetical protein
MKRREFITLRSREPTPATSEYALFASYKAQGIYRCSKAASAQNQGAH